MAYHTYGQLKDLGERVRKRAVDITAGKEYDLAKVMYRPDPRNPQQDASDFPSRAEVRAAAKKAYAMVPDLFTNFATPDPEKSHSPIINQMWDVCHALKPDLKLAYKKGDKVHKRLSPGSWTPGVSFEQRSNQLVQHLKHWDGHAADAFNEHFVTKIHPSQEVQGSLASSLAITMEAHKKIRTSFHTDIWAIGQNTIKVLDSIGGCGGADGIETALTVGVAIASVLLAIPTDGVSLIGLAGLAKEGASLAGTIRGSQHKNQSAMIEGPTVDAIMKSMGKAVTKLTNQVDGQESSLAKVINELSMGVDKNSNKFLVPKSGSLINASDDSRSQLEGNREFYDR